MTDELIEVVAKALYESGKFRFSPAWDDDKVGHTRELCRRDARAALQAIEASGTHVVVPLMPTEKMLRAGVDGRFASNSVAESTYETMLAARPKVTTNG